MLPFTPEVYVSLLATYNQAMNPAHVVAAVFALVMLLSVGGRYRFADRLIAVLLAAFWLWTGIAFHYFYFSTINFVAPVFALLFVLQGLVLIWTGTIRGGLEFRQPDIPRSWIAMGLVIFLFVIYDLIAGIFDRDWPASAELGVAPTPTTIVTLGFLMLLQPRAPWHLLAIPLLWCLTGAAYGWFLGIYEDLSLLPAAVMAVAMRRTGRG